MVTKLSQLDHLIHQSNRNPVSNLIIEMINCQVNHKFYHLSRKGLIIEA